MCVCVCVCVPGRRAGSASYTVAAPCRRGRRQARCLDSTQSPRDLEPISSRSRADLAAGGLDLGWISRLYLGCISAVSRLDLGWISAAGGVAASEARGFEGGGAGGGVGEGGRAEEGVVVEEEGHLIG